MAGQRMQTSTPLHKNPRCVDNLETYQGATQRGSSRQQGSSGSSEALDLQEIHQAKATTPREFTYSFIASIASAEST